MDDVGDYSFGYIAGWSASREMKELRSSMNTIRDTAAKIIDGIEAELAKDQTLETFIGSAADEKQAVSDEKAGISKPDIPKAAEHPDSLKNTSVLARLAVAKAESAELMAAKAPSASIPAPEAVSRRKEAVL